MVAKYYTGIGSRDIDPLAEIAIHKVATVMHELGIGLRSGGANGADSMFEKHCQDGEDVKQIFLPWKKFNGNLSALYRIDDRAKVMAKHYHPLKDELVSPSLDFMARNCYQVLGQDLQTPSVCVLCWTRNPLFGGTSQAIRIANDYNIPVYNLYDIPKEQLDLMLEHLKQTYVNNNN